MDSRFAAIAALVLALASGPAATAQDVHQDARLGFKLRPPKDFSQVPLKPDEEWIAARWISDKAYFQTDKTDGWTRDHKPELFVIAFPHAKSVTEKVEVGKVSVEGGDVTLYVPKNPFKDYKDYLKRTYNEGGFYVSAEEKLDLEGVAVETLEIKVERGLSGGPRRIVTWVYKGTDTDFAVQFELVEAAWTKVKGDVLGCLRSFRRIAKDASAKADSSSGAPKVTDKNLDELNPAQRAARRREMAKVAQEKASKDLPDGWWAKKMGRVFVLSHVDEKTAAKFSADATAVLDYLDDNLGYVGPGEYVREPTLRICKDYDEFHLYHKGESGFSFSFLWDSSREVVTYKDTGYRAFTSGDVTEAVAEHWLRERSDDLYLASPFWLRIGFSRAFASSKAKGSKLEFYNDSYERSDVAEQIRAGKFSTLKELMHFDADGFSAGDYNKYAECAAGVRFLLSGPKKAKDALRAYLDALSPVAKQRAEERKKLVEDTPAKKAKSEEEEDAAFKAAQTKMRNQDKQILEDAWKRAFGSWSESDWKLLEAAYQKSLD